MMRRGLAFALTLLVLAALTPEVAALITRLTALQDMLSEATYIVVAKVESIDAKRPAMILALDEALKGKPDWKRLPILLVGDARAKKLKETPQLLDRVEPKLPIVLFVNKLDNDYAAFAFTNGSWFSLNGTTVDGEVRWAFTHLEPFLRRTYKGTTAEMLRDLRAALAGTKKLPPPDSTEKPGLGPTLRKKSGHLAPSRPPARAVIPTVLVGGPLAMLAMLFPAVFGGWKRWFALLSIAGTNSTLVTLQWWFAESLVGSWWGTPTALWTCMSLVSILGVCWAWQRHLRRVQLGEAPLLAGGVEFVVLLLTSLVGVATLVVCKWLQQPLLSPIWLPVVVLILAVWGGTAYVLWTWLRGPRLIPALATEAVVLTALALATVGFAPALSSRLRAGGLAPTEETTSPARLTVDLVWSFRLPDKGALASTPVVVGNRVYIAAAHDSVFRPYGTLYCLDRTTGQTLWNFSNGKKMKQVFSTPTVVGDRLYIGEGFHQDDECKVYCLDAVKGTKLWEFQTASHTEASPTVVDGRVYMGAGDDGIFCLRADNGERIWNFPGFHIDASAAVVGDRVYVGCGIGDAYKQTAVLCLDARTGKPHWRIHTDLPVWSRPLVAEEFVFIGTGNGRLNEAAEKPDGSVYCLRADSGAEVWKTRLPDGVLARLALDRDRLYFGCRDGSFYALRRSDGHKLWSHDLGSPIVSAPALESCSCCGTLGGRLYVGTLEGRLACLDPASGHLVWSRDLVERSQVPIELVASPALEVRGSSRRLYVAVTMISSARTGELLCFEERPSE